MNVTMKERQLECAEHSLLAATDLGAHMRTNYVAILESMRTYVSRASDHAHANAALLMDFWKRSLTRTASVISLMPPASSLRGSSSCRPVE